MTYELSEFTGNHLSELMLLYEPVIPNIIAGLNSYQALLRL